MNIPRAFVFALALLASQSTLAQYSVINLGSLGYQLVSANAINDSGQVAGVATLQLSNGTRTRAFLWTPTTGLLQSLGVLGSGGAGNSFANGLSSNGFITGGSTDSDFIVDAFLWSSSTGMLDSGFQNVGLAVNSVGLVVGYSYNQEGYYNVYSSSGNLSGAGYTHSRATAVNDSGYAAGSGYGTRTGLQEALVWMPDGTSLALGTLPGGRNSQAFGISSNNLVVGSSTVTGGAIHPFVASFYGGLEDLGLLSGFTSCVANGINSSEVVVGQCTPSSGDPHAFVWTSTGGMQDLNGLVVDNPYGTITNADGINSSGQIAATAGNGYPSYAVLLNP
jgi:probable HAF family extracellular repeat protein